MAVPSLGSEFDLRTLSPSAFEGLVAGLHLRDDIEAETEVVPEIRIDRWSNGLSLPCFSCNPILIL